MEKVFVQGIGPVFLGSFSSRGSSGGSSSRGSSRGHVDLPESRDVYTKHDACTVIKDSTTKNTAPDDEAVRSRLKVEVTKEEKAF